MTDDDFCIKLIMAIYRGKELVEVGYENISALSGYDICGNLTKIVPENADMVCAYAWKNGIVPICCAEKIAVVQL